jgi:hypothetical protein
MTGLGGCIWATALVVLLSGGTARAAERPTAVLPPEAGPFVRHLLPASGLADRLDFELRMDHAVYRFRKREARAEVRLSHPSTCAAPDGPLCVTLVAADGPGAEALAREACTALTSALRQSTGGPMWVFPAPHVANMARDPIPIGFYRLHEHR